MEKELTGWWKTKIKLSLIWAFFYFESAFVIGTIDFYGGSISVQCEDVFA